MLVAAAVLLGGASAGPDMLSAARAAGHGSPAQSCDAWRWRAVAPREMALTDLTAEAGRTRVWRVRRLPGWADGAALPGTAILTEDAELGTWIHEHIHLVQMRQDGTARFWSRYTADYLRGRWSGCGAHDSYLAIGYEREARALERSLLAETYASSTRHDPAR